MANEENRGPPPILQYFGYGHLPAHLATVSAPICDLAHHYAKTLPPGPETTVGLRKLLEAKDAFVRAAIPPEVIGKVRG